MTENVSREKIADQFPRYTLSDMFEAIGSKILSLNQLFHTPNNFKFEQFAAGAFR